jgi:polyhydroxyalkanoate synthesis regulator phasin
MDEYTLDELDPKFLFPMLEIEGTLLEEIYREVVGDDLVEKFEKEIIEYGKDVYKDYQTKLQEAHKKLPEQHARRLDELLQKINKLNPYEDPSKWIDIFKSLPVYHLMNSIANSIIKHAKGNEIEKIPNVLEYLSKPEVYKTLLTTYIIKYQSALETHKVQSADEKLEQMIYLKASNDTQKYMEAIQNYVQEVIKTISSALQDASSYIEDTIEELFNMNEKEFNKKIKNVLQEHRDVVLGLRILDTLFKYS